MDNRKNRWTDKEVEQHWDRVASVYVHENNKVKKAHDQRYIESIRHLDLFPGARILNITSRDCEANDYIIKAESEVEVINAEISSGLMEVAQSIRPYIKQVKLNNYSALPFENGAFNRVLSLETLEHVAEPIEFLKELYRVSQPDVKLVLSCPPATSEIPYRMFTFLFGGHGEGPHRFPSSHEVKDWLKETGWELVFHKGTVLLPVGPPFMQKTAERFIERFQNTFISELGIRQFYVCKKY
jgi:SAM-dependent methyltransferase